MFLVWEFKEDLRAVFRAQASIEASWLLDVWLREAVYCKIKPAVEVEKKVRCRRADIVAAVELDIRNA